MRYDQIFATSQNKMKDIMKKVIERCQNDKIFEEDLRNNPTEILQKEGLELQPGIRIQIIKTVAEANSLPDNVIPLSLDNRKSVLSQEELEKVAGGCSHDNTTNPHTFGLDGYWNCE